MRNKSNGGKRSANGNYASKVIFLAGQEGPKVVLPVS